MFIIIIIIIIIIILLLLLLLLYYINGELMETRENVFRPHLSHLKSMVQ